MMMNTDPSVFFKSWESVFSVFHSQFFCLFVTPSLFAPSLASLLLMLLILLAQVLLTLDPMTGSVFVIMYIHFLESFGMDERKRREQELRENKTWELSFLSTLSCNMCVSVLLLFHFIFFSFFYISSFIPCCWTWEFSSYLLLSFSSLLILFFFHLTMITLQNDLWLNKWPNKLSKKGLRTRTLVGYSSSFSSLPLFFS